MADSAFINTPDGKIHYQRAGTGNPVVLLHSVGQAANIWEEAMSILARHFSVFAMDMIGHGETEKARREYSIEDYARSVINFTTALGIGRASIVANSIGASIAVAVASEHPERVAKLVLVGCPALNSEMDRRERMSIARSQLDVNGNPKMYTLDEIKYLYRKVDAALLERMNTNRAKAGSNYIMALNALYTYDITAHLGKIDCTTLVIFGRNDPLLEKAPVLIQGIRGSRLVIIEDAYHLPQVDDPQAFSQIVTSFLIDDR